MTEPNNSALAAVESLVREGLAGSDDRILGEIMEGKAGVAIAYKPAGGDLAIGVFDPSASVVREDQQVYLDSSGVNLLISALVDMGLVDRKKELT